MTSEAGSPPDLPLPPPPPPPAAPPPPSPLATMTFPGRTFLAQMDQTGWRPTVIVAVILLALVFGSQVLDGLLPGGAPGVPVSQPGAGQPIEVGYGVRVYAPAGWSEVSISTGQIRLEKGATVIDVYVFEGFTGDSSDLLTSYANEYLRTSSSQLQLSNTQVIAGSPGSPDARATYVGNFNNVQQPIEGELTAAILGSHGIVFDGWASQGQLASALADIERTTQTVALD